MLSKINRAGQYFSLEKMFSLLLCGLVIALSESVLSNWPRRSKPAISLGFQAEFRLFLSMDGSTPPPSGISGSCRMNMSGTLCGNATEPVHPTKISIKY